MLGGLKADIDLASNARAKRADELVKIQKYDYGYELGVGFNFYFPSFIFSPEIKISNGLKNIHSRDENLKYSNVLDRITSRMIVFELVREVVGDRRLPRRDPQCGTDAAVGDVDLVVR